VKKNMTICPRNMSLAIEELVFDSSLLILGSRPYATLPYYFSLRRLP